MEKIIKRAAFFNLVVLVCCCILNAYQKKDWLLTMIITFAAITYHLGMRLLVGCIVNHCMNNKADITKKWYQIHPIESRIYKAIKVKKWKNKMPTYDPARFLPSEHSWEEIAQAMCQAEIVHEINVILSFLPIAASVFAGAFFVFFITSLLAALLDLCFVIMQRYNRPRVIKMANRHK